MMKWVFVWVVFLMSPVFVAAQEATDYHPDVSLSTPVFSELPKNKLSLGVTLSNLKETPSASFILSFDFVPKTEDGSIEQQKVGSQVQELAFSLKGNEQKTIEKVVDVPKSLSGDNYVFATLYTASGTLKDRLLLGTFTASGQGLGEIQPMVFDQANDSLQHFSLDQPNYRSGDTAHVTYRVFTLSNNPKWRDYTLDFSLKNSAGFLCAEEKTEKHPFSTLSYDLPITRDCDAPFLTLALKGKDGQTADTLTITPTDDKSTRPDGQQNPQAQEIREFFSLRTVAITVVIILFLSSLWFIFRRKLQRT